MFPTLSGVFSLLLCVTFGNAVNLDVLVHYPKSLSLSIRGDGCGLNWDKGIKVPTSGNDQWKVSLNCTESKVEMKVLVDDKVWMIGANHHADLTKSGSNAVTEIYPWFYTYTGTLKTISKVYSPELKNYRDIIYYLPPSYYENTLKTYQNVLVMHDGQNLFDPRTAYMGNAWMCQDALDTTIVGGTSDEVIIAGAYNTDDRINEYTYVYDPSEKAGGKGDLYLDWIESTLIPTTQQNFRVSITRDRLGILGSSLGGLISCYAGWTRSHVYGKVGCMSSSFWWDFNNFQNEIIPASVPDEPVPIIYMDSGSGSVGEIQCTEYTAQIYQMMKDDGFEENKEVFKYVDPGASHSETYWGPRFHIPIENLYPASTV